MKAVLLVSHGSKSPQSRQEIDALAARLAAQAAVPAAKPPATPAGTGTADPFRIFESAFLEIEKPSIPEGLALCAKRGATEIIVLLNFLNSGRHVLEDVPRLVREFESAHPTVSCKVTPCLGLYEGIDRVYLDLIQKVSS